MRRCGSEHLVSNAPDSLRMNASIRTVRNTKSLGNARDVRVFPCFTARRTLTASKRSHKSTRASTWRCSHRATTSSSGRGRAASPASDGPRHAEDVVRDTHRIRLPNRSSQKSSLSNSTTTLRTAVGFVSGILTLEVQEALEAGSCLASVSKSTVPDPQGGTLFGISYLLL